MEVVFEIKIFEIGITDFDIGALNCYIFSKKLSRIVFIYLSIGVFGDLLNVAYHIYV